MKHRSGENSFKLIPALLAFLALALTLTSCAPKQEPFDLEEVETLRPPSSVRVIPAGQLEGVKMSVSWSPSPDDRYFTGVIAPRPVPGQLPNLKTKYEVKTFDDRPRDSRTKYEIYRAVVKPGEDIYSLPSDRFIKVGEVDEGEYQFSDEHTTPQRLLWQAKRREVKKIPRVMVMLKTDSSEVKADSPEMEPKLKKEKEKGFKVEASVNNTHYYILQKTGEKTQVPGTLSPEGIPLLPDVSVQKAIMEKLAENWEFKGHKPAVFVFKKPVFDFYSIREISYITGPDGKPVEADRKALEEAKKDGRILYEVIPEVIEVRRAVDTFEICEFYGKDASPRKDIIDTIKRIEEDGWKKVKTEPMTFVLKRPISERQGAPQTLKIKVVPGADRKPDAETQKKIDHALADNYKRKTALMTYLFERPSEEEKNVSEAVEMDVVVDSEDKPVDGFAEAIKAKEKDGWKVVRKHLAEITFERTSELMDMKGTLDKPDEATQKKIDAKRPEGWTLIGKKMSYTFTRPGEGEEGVEESTRKTLRTDLDGNPTEESQAEINKMKEEKWSFDKGKIEFGSFLLERRIEVKEIPVDSPLSPNGEYDKASREAIEKAEKEGWARVGSEELRYYGVSRPDNGEVFSLQEILVTLDVDWKPGGDSARDIKDITDKGYTLRWRRPTKVMLRKCVEVMTLSPKDTSSADAMKQFNEKLEKLQKDEKWVLVESNPGRTIFEKRREIKEIRLDLPEAERLQAIKDAEAAGWVRIGPRRKYLLTRPAEESDGKPEAKEILAIPAGDGGIDKLSDEEIKALKKDGWTVKEIRPDALVFQNSDDSKTNPIFPVPGKTPAETGKEIRKIQEADGWKYVEILPETHLFTRQKTDGAEETLRVNILLTPEGEPAEKSRKELDKAAVDGWKLKEVLHRRLVFKRAAKTRRIAMLPDFQGKPDLAEVKEAGEHYWMEMAGGSSGGRGILKCPHEEKEIGLKYDVNGKPDEDTSKVLAEAEVDGWKVLLSEKWLFTRTVGEGEAKKTDKMEVTVWFRGLSTLDRPSSEKVARLRKSGWQIQVGKPIARTLARPNAKFDKYEEKKIPVRLTPDGKVEARSKAAVTKMRRRIGWFLNEAKPGQFIFARSLGYCPTLSKGETYVYKVRFIYGENPDGSPRCADSTPSLPVTSTSGLFRFDRLVNLILVITFIAVASYFIFSARSGKEMYIRPIAGIAAVEEAVGRATEMGRPALFVPGIGAIAGPATLASMAILSKIAEKTAQYDTDLMVPNFNIFVLQVSQETIKEAYLKAGRPDAYNPDMAFFMSDRQFAYAAGISGIIARRRPAAIFLLGTFYAESLLLAEAGANIGAIQIAGTDMDHQLPFFITACDYTLIGEELYAAGAYLSRDPKLLGTLKGQDYFKVIVIILTVITVPLVIILMATGVLNVGTFLKFFFDSEFILP